MEYNWVNNYMKQFYQRFMKVEIYRHKNTIKKGQTLGTLCIETEDNTEVLWSCKTLELEWNGNKRQESCIPAGSYKATKWNSPKFGACFKIHGVEGRSDILIHAGNYKKQTKGCILVGERFIDIDKDGATDISNSKVTLNRMLELLPSDFKLTIHN